MRKTLLFSTALFFSVTAFGAIDALNFSSSQQEDDYHSLTQELRCPQCQNNNIADSNATIAVDMRGKVFEFLQEGKSREDGVKYMVDRYGNFVTYAGNRGSLGSTDYLNFVWRIVCFSS